MRICGQNQPSNAESIEICVSLTSKYGCRVQLATYTAILLVCIANLMKKSGHNDKLLNTELKMRVLGVWQALPTMKNACRLYTVDGGLMTCKH